MTPGDARWEALQGQISATERFQYASAAVAARLRYLARRLGPARRARALDRLALERITYPDSACANSALEKVRALASPAVTNHSLRTFIWGSLLGQLDGKRWDPEVLFVASMVHDLGLTEALHGSCRGARCFTLDGVNGVPEVFAQTSPERAERMRRAVLLHLNIAVPGAVHGWEAHYLQAGAALDVVGQRHDELPRATVEATLKLHPRLNLKDELVTWVRREARLRTDSRMAMLTRLGFATLIRRAPFES
jgi:hypothetical protein